MLQPMAGGVQIMPMGHPSAVVPMAVEQPMVASAQPMSVPMAAAVLVNDPVEKLAKLKEMLDRGLLSESEYNAKKAEVLATM